MTNQTNFSTTVPGQLNPDLQVQQSLLWEFYKTWVNNQTDLDSIAQMPEMFGLYQRLSLLLNASLNQDVAYTLNEKPLLKFTEPNFTAVINLICDVIAPEKIFCLNHQKGSDGADHADLILVIPEKSAKTFEEIEKVFDFVCLKHHHLSCTLFKASFFYKMIAEGHIYFSLACNAESLIYDDGSNQLPKLRLDNRGAKMAHANQQFYSGLVKARTFYTAAENYYNSNLNMAAFMLHQATELCLRALNKSLTTQDKTTHSLTALLKFNLRITTKLARMMNNGDAEDERLIALLEGAYLGYRYTEKYSIEENDLNALFEKVKTLHVYAEEIFLVWMKKYDLLINTAQHD